MKETIEFTHTNQFYERLPHKTVNNIKIEQPQVFTVFEWENYIKNGKIFGGQAFPVSYNYFFPFNGEDRLVLKEVDYDINIPLTIEGLDDIPEYASFVLWK
jgi:hypothetical protein